MVDLEALQRTIRTAPEGEAAAVVTRRWLERVYRDLSELAAIRSAQQAK